MADDTRTIVARHWCSLLGVSDVEDGDDFFMLGGHSLLAVQLAERLEQTLRIEFPFETLFTSGSFGAVAAACAELREAA
jgi:acyl carrier protein